MLAQLQTTSYLWKNEDGSLEGWEIALIVIACLCVCSWIFWGIVFCCSVAVLTDLVKDAEQKQKEAAEQAEKDAKEKEGEDKKEEGDAPKEGDAAPADAEAAK